MHSPVPARTNVLNILLYVEIQMVLFLGVVLTIMIVTAPQKMGRGLFMLALQIGVGRFVRIPIMPFSLAKGKEMLRGDVIGTVAGEGIVKVHTTAKARMLRRVSPSVQATASPVEEEALVVVVIVVVMPLFVTVEDVIHRPRAHIAKVRTTVKAHTTAKVHTVVVTAKARITARVVIVVGVAILTK